MSYEALGKLMTGLARNFTYVKLGIEENVLSESQTYVILVGLVRRGKTFTFKQTFSELELGLMHDPDVIVDAMLSKAHREFSSS